jgi:hypothetical protein
VAFPTVIARSGATTAASTSHTITLPAGAAAGHLYLVVMGMDGLVTLSTVTGGWTKVGQGAGSNGVTAGVFAGIAGTATTPLVITSSTSADGAHNSWDIDGWSGTVANLSFATATGAGSAGTPPALTPAGGAKDFLWVVNCSANSGALLPTAAPAGFSNFVSRTFGTAATDGNVGTAELSLNTATETPGAYTRTVSGGWECDTISIPPSLVVPGPGPKPLVVNQAALHRAYNF